MNGLTGRRRLASPVRITLNSALGGDIDGAWWPHSFELARELPELIEALHPVLGEIIDIKLNWLAARNNPMPKPLSSHSMSMHGWNDRQHRLMLVAGRTGTARLLVVPSSTSATLGWMVMRRAAEMSLAGGEDDGQLVETANAVMRTVRGEGSAWAAQLVDSAKTAETTG